MAPSLVLTGCVLLSLSQLTQANLRASFPFSEAELDVGRPARQGNQQNSVDFNSVAKAGKQCIDKVTVQEETEYDEEYRCEHSYNKRCTTSYTTVYEAQQEEECEENFQKDCFIEYAKTADRVEVEVCVEPLVKDCSVPGPETCSTEYQTECETVQERHQVEDDVAECQQQLESKCEEEVSGYTTSQQCSDWPVQRCSVSKKPVLKLSPHTSCRKVAVELCGPSTCPVVPGPQECRTITKTIAGEKPEEQCSLEPKRSCKHVTKLVPQLKPRESCTDVPKEVCVRSQTNPRKVQKPVLKRWCYSPTKESGLPPPQSPPAIPSVEEASLSNAQQCPESCIEAQRLGICEPGCNEYASVCGTRPCQPTTTTTQPPPSCPSFCRPENQAPGQCNPSCNQYSSLCGTRPCQPPTTTTTPPAPTCPARCQPSYQAPGSCDPSCNDYANICGTRPCQPTTTPAPPQCPSACRPGFQSNGRCEPQCDVALCGYDPDCDPPPLSPPEPTEAPLGYLPPPPEYGRSGSLNTKQQNRRPLNSSLSLPRRPKFSRKQSSRFGGARARTTSQKLKQRPRGERENTSPVRNNWDLYLRTGIIQRKTG